MTAPLGYLITWTTYGTWLHGDERGWVESGVYGIQPPDPQRLAIASGRMTAPAVTLGAAQRQVVEATIRQHCRVWGWELHAVNVRSNHVPVVVNADRTPEEVMRQFKAWCSRRLTEAEGPSKEGKPPKDGARRWWTEHGSTKWINDEEYLENAVRYVTEGQDVRR